MTRYWPPRPGTVVAASCVAGVAAAVALSLLHATSVNAGTPTPTGPVVTVATGPDWTLTAWKSDRGLCLSHRPRPLTTYCIGGAMRRGHMFTGFSGPMTSDFVVTGVVTRAVRKLVVVDADSRRSVALYAAPQRLNTRLRFFRERVRRRGVNPTGIQWMLTALDGRGNVLSITGQGRNVAGSAAACPATPVQRHTVRAGPFVGGIVPEYDVVEGRFRLHVGAMRDKAIGLSQKIPWFANRRAEITGSLTVMGTRLNRQPPRQFSQVFPSGGGRVFPSIIKPPLPGCWRLQFTSGSAKGSLIVLVTY